MTWDALCFHQFLPVEYSTPEIKKLANLVTRKTWNKHEAAVVLTLA